MPPERHPGWRPDIVYVTFATREAGLANMAWVACSAAGGYVPGMTAARRAAGNGANGWRALVLF